MVLIKLIKNSSLNWNNFFNLKKVNKIIELNHEEIVVAMGIMINPILLKKYRLIKIFNNTEIKEI